jgi:hypothetical protein
VSHPRFGLAYRLCNPPVTVVAAHDQAATVSISASSILSRGHPESVAERLRKKFNQRRRMGIPLHLEQRPARGDVSLSESNQPDAEKRAAGPNYSSKPQFARVPGLFCGCSRPLRPYEQLGLSKAKGKWYPTGWSPVAGRRSNSEAQAPLATTRPVKPCGRNRATGVTVRILLARERCTDRPSTRLDYLR